MEESFSKIIDIEKRLRIACAENLELAHRMRCLSVKNPAIKISKAQNLSTSFLIFSHVHKLSHRLENQKEFKDTHGNTNSSHSL